MTNVSAGSFQFVFPNQTIVGTTVLGGGFQIVLSGGETVGEVINGVQLAGGTENNTTIAGGGEQLVFSSSEFFAFSGFGSSLNASAISAIESNLGALGSAGALISGFGGVSAFISAIESGFTLGFMGMARNTTIDSGGIQIVADGAVATDTTINSGGAQAVAGGLASDTIVSKGGLQAVGPGSSGAAGEADGTNAHRGRATCCLRGHRQRNRDRRWGRRRNVRQRPVPPAQNSFSPAARPKARLSAAAAASSCKAAPH
jgi:autotransporter passenger strand-loop-strand repeat protein